jgi:hypothetical protein
MSLNNEAGNYNLLHTAKQYQSKKLQAGQKVQIELTSENDVSAFKHSNKNLNFKLFSVILLPLKGMVHDK